MAPRRAFVLIGSAAFVAYVSWGVINAGSDGTSAPQQVPLAVDHGFATGHRYTATSWTIDYDHIEASTDSNIINARGIRDAVIYRHGKPYIHLKADHIEANLANKDFRATGHIRAEQKVNGTKRTFETGSATWTEANQLLLMPNRILLKESGMRVQLHHLTFDVRTGTVKAGAIDASVHG